MIIIILILKNKIINYNYRKLKNNKFKIIDKIH